MSAPNDGGSAFPVIEGFREAGGGGWQQVECGGGMSLRAWLAGKALPAVIADHAATARELGGEVDEADIAASTCAIADALIAELNRADEPAPAAEVFDAIEAEHGPCPEPNNPECSCAACRASEAADEAARRAAP